MPCPMERGPCSKVGGARPGRVWCGNVTLEVAEHLISGGGGTECRLETSANGVIGSLSQAMWIGRNRRRCDSGRGGTRSERL